MLMDPHPSQHHAGLHHAVWQPQPKVTSDYSTRNWLLPVSLLCPPPLLTFHCLLPSLPT